MMDGNDGGGAAEDQEPWETSPAYKTRSNSPLKRAMRASPVWGMIKRLDDDNPKTDEGNTHTCIHAGCGYFMKLKKTPKATDPRPSASIIPRLPIPLPTSGRSTSSQRRLPR